MTGAGRYAELAAAVRSFKAELMPRNQIERFVEAGSLPEIIGVLTQGHVTYSDGSGLFQVEAYLIQRIIELCGRLAAYAPHDSRPFIKLFSVGYEMECAKEILRSIADHTEPDEALKHLVPAGKFTQDRCQELIEARNPSRVVDFIEDEALKRFLAPKLASERGIAATFAIDRYYYTRLWAASNLPDPIDSQMARGLIGEAIDHMNILIGVRARLMGLDARSASDLLIPVNYALGNSLNEVVDSANIQNVLRVLEKTPYGRAFQGSSLGEGHVAGVEGALNRSHATTCLNAFAGSPFNVGLPISLLFLKKYELRDMFAIINGKANGAPMERVLDSLILNLS